MFVLGREAKGVNIASDNIPIFVLFLSIFLYIKLEFIRFFFQFPTSIIKLLPCVFVIFLLFSTFYFDSNSYDTLGAPLLVLELDQ